MSKTILFVIFIVGVGGALAGGRSVPLGEIACGDLAERPHPPAFTRNDGAANGRAHPTGTSALSCAQPGPANRQACQELEQQMLASTVRLAWQRWRVKDNSSGNTLLNVTKGYGTIKEGRYLVTHNHTGMPLATTKDGTFVTLSVFTTGGDPLLLHTRLPKIIITELSSETLLLDFGPFGGRGLFAADGRPSAKFMSWDTAPLEPGLEVAQIGHDGSTVRVDWVTIDKVILQGDTPRVELANFVWPGASGGGVFWNGYHIANTWSQVTVCDSSSGAVVDQHSVAALNSPQLAAPAIRTARTLSASH